MALRTSLVAQPHLYMGDTQGRPLDAGKVYFGEPNKDPELYPINVYYDEVLTIAAPQPIRTMGGFMNANGQMVEIYAAETEYSVKVLDAYGRQVFYQESMSSENAQIAAQKLDTGITATAKFGGVERSQADKNIDTVSTNDFISTDDAASAAFTARKPLVIDSAVSTASKLTFDAANLQSMVNWLQRQPATNNEKLKIVIPDGLHIVDTYLDVIGNGNTVEIEAASITPAMIKILAVAYSEFNVSKKLYKAVLTLAEALPTHIVVGWGVGCQNMDGDRGAPLLNGAHTITAISTDRLTVEFNFYCPITPTNPTLLNTNTNYGLTSNTLIVPHACIVAKNTGWDGSAREGFINCMNGGRVKLRNIAIVYDGGITEHDLLFAHGNGSRIELADRCVLSGAGDKVIRLYGNSEFFANRSCVGSSTTAREIVHSIFGSTANLARCSIGGGSVYNLIASTAGFIGFTNGCIASGATTGRTIGAGSVIAVQSSRISGGTYGINASSGSIYINALKVEMFSIGLTYATGGFVTGTAIFGTGEQANTRDSVAAANTYYNGGAWIRDAEDIKHSLLSASIAKSGVFEKTLTGTAGTIKIIPETAVTSGAEIDVVLSNASTSARYLGASSVLGAGATVAPLNDGKVTYSVYDSGGAIKVRILNEMSATRKFKIEVVGDLKLS